jgi:transcriptional regulator with XRE-family HTH domain
MTQLDLAKNLGLSRAAIAQWESGVTSPALATVGDVAKLMGVQPAFLAYGVTDEPVVEYRSPEGTVAVPEIRFGDKLSDQQVDGEWSLPVSYLKNDLHVVSTDGIVIFRVESDAMAPAWEYGDRVIVDTNAKRPSPSGTFLIWDGIGPALASLSVGQMTGGKQVIRVSTGGETDEVPLDKLGPNIIGRVKGRLHVS